MSHTNTTPNYNLPQFVGSDKPAWLTDVNNAMSAIDTAIAAAKAAADNAGGAAASLATTVGGHTTQLETLSTTVTNQGTAIVSQGNSINTISELIGNGTPTTTDHTLIGAINELNAKEGDLADLTTTDKSSLVAAINEAAAGGGAGGSVQVVADGVKSLATLFNELYALVDFTKISKSSVLNINEGVEYYPISVKASDNSSIKFCQALCDASNFSLTTAELKSTGSTIINANRTANSDLSATVATNGTKIIIFY